MTNLIYSQEYNFDPSKLTRSKEVQIRYDLRLKLIAKAGVTAERYIIDTVFGLSPSLIKIVPNEFPYELPPGQVHMLVWTRNIEPITPENLISSLKLFYPPNSIRAIWQNDAGKQSVKGLIHYHFILY